MAAESLSRWKGEDTGLAPWDTLMWKADSASSTSIAMARTPRPCLDAKWRQASWLKVGMEAVAVGPTFSMVAKEGE